MIEIEENSWHYKLAKVGSTHIKLQLQPLTIDKCTYTKAVAKGLGIILFLSAGIGTFIVYPIAGALHWLYDWAITGGQPMMPAIDSSLHWMNFLMAYALVTVLIFGLLIFGIILAGVEEIIETIKHRAWKRAVGMAKPSWLSKKKKQIKNYLCAEIKLPSE